ncbi:limbic system-associated membrane protein isoform X2 [Colletes latitarsis]|uniref:limbic system-associated membrane protein isoform X2 n=1 Tax=Colletes latitarsis TaxID=2605962 RepID=UPI0040350F51
MVPFGWMFCIFIVGNRAAVNNGFKSYPTTVKTFENDTVLLPCYVEDVDKVQTMVRWWRDGILLADSGEPRHVPPERVRMYLNRSLEVSHVKRNDTGVYVCQASRPAPWRYATQVHEIEVMYPPTVRPVPESGKLEVNLGEEVDMACVAKGVPVPIISWRNKDGEIPLLYDRSRLQFHAESPSDAGRYTCVANNDVGEPASATIDLFIRYKPRIEMSKTWMHAPPGIRVQLNCGVTAWPEATVEWYFNNRSVKYSSGIVKHNAGSDHSLVIRNVRTTDYGFYLCRASNSLGITEAAVELSGVANPATIKKTSHSLSKTSYNFVWEVYSYSPIVQYEFRFRKYRNGVPGEWHTLYIPSGHDGNSFIHTYSFNLTGLEEATHYEAIVLSKNRYGWSKSSEIIRFATEGAPDRDNYMTNAIQEDKLVPAKDYSFGPGISGSSINQGGVIAMIPVLYICSVHSEVLKNLYKVLSSLRVTN